MAGINFIGSYSGIDQSSIDKLMEVERLPLKKYTTQKTNITGQQNAWKDINSRLNNLFDKINALKKVDTFSSNKAASTNEDIVSMTASKNAIAGVYKINIKQLATSTSITGKQVIAPATIGGKENNSKSLNINGSFTIGSSDNKNITIDVVEEDSLHAIAKKINDAKSEAIGIEGEEGYIAPQKIGIRATVIDNRLVLTDEKTGDRTISLSNVSVDNDVLSDIGLTTMSDVTYPLDKNEATFNGVKFTKGLHAEFSINGIDSTSDTNAVTNIIEGATINLKKVGETTTVTIGLDIEKASAALDEFVKQYNSTMQFIQEQINAGNPDVEGSRGALAGENSLMRLHSSLASLVTSQFSNNKDEIRDISQLGVTTIDKSGQLTFDSEKLKKALEENPEMVTKFFHSIKKETIDGQEKDVEIGFVAKLNEQIDTFISKENGIIKTKNESFDKTLKDITRRIEDFEARMVKKEEQLVKKFTALDVAMMKAESQMTWLQGQVDAMNGIKR